MDNLDNRRIYDNWAGSYEEYVKTLEYQGPQSLVFTLNNFLINTQINKKLDILDFGCGTGLIGLEINKKFNKDFSLDGIDISSKMIDKSREKNIYNNLWNLDITKENIDKKYDIIVSSGVFLEGHAPFNLINNLLDITKKNGLLFITFRQTYINKNNKEFEINVKNNHRINIINNIEINYLPEVKCKLIIMKKINN
tara:strand:+ start:18349 stop:18936 length:588 start_codon:yes stop_codon:yes gene_type:complete